MTDSTISFEITRFWFLRGVALVYTLAYLNIINQFPGLLSSKGLLPIKSFITRIPFKFTPSLFYYNSSDRFVRTFSWIGFFLSLVALTGLSDLFGFGLFLIVWISLWVIYQSFVNVGQDFYSFGWESMLLETGFAVLFFGPTSSLAHPLNIWLVRWLLFRTMFGAGLIKLRGDSCWWDLTCLHYHYETQPIPNAISWYLHRLPGWFHKFCVLLTHFVELIVPWLILIPGTPCAIAGLLTIFFQASLIVSGNLCWLNLLTIVYCIPCFSDQQLSFLYNFTPEVMTSLTNLHLIAILTYSLFVLYYSIPIVVNLLSTHQIMNACSAPYHLLGSYGAFGSITKKRYEIIISGTNGDPADPNSEWKEYLFIGKPSDPKARPPFTAPYHYRLDWLMWFAAMGPHYHYPWLKTLLHKLLTNEQVVLGLIQENPFPNTPPRAVKMDLYRYQFTKGNNSNWWEREFIGVYIPAQKLS